MAAGPCFLGLALPALDVAEITGRLAAQGALAVALSLDNLLVKTYTTKNLEQSLAIAQKEK